MQQTVSKNQLRGYLAARSRAARFIRDSSPPLTNRGLATVLELEKSAFNKFMNGTIFVDAEGNTIPARAIESAPELYLRSKWTLARMSRFIERVETGCWKMGISHSRTMLKSAARDEAERIRLSKYFDHMCAIKNADLGVASGIAIWNAFAQDAYDAREHLRPTMCVNALMALGDLVDRKENGQLCTLAFTGRAQLQRLEYTVNSVAALIYSVHELTGDPCLENSNTKKFECHHKAHGYGGYNKYFLGLALGAEQIQEEGVENLFQSIIAEHHPNDGHVANTATVIESAIAAANPQATRWAHEFQAFVGESMTSQAGFERCKRLLDMRIPELRTNWGDAFFRAIAKFTVLLICCSPIFERNAICKACDGSTEQPIETAELFADVDWPIAAAPNTEVHLTLLQTKNHTKQGVRR